MMTLKTTTLALLLFSPLSFSACTGDKSRTQDRSDVAPDEAMTPVQTEGLATAYFASGCFWCVEAIFESVIGVKEAVSGYAGGDEMSPTYGDVSRGATGHTETVQVFYDSSVVDYPTLLKVYYGSHDPTTVNGQKPDFGPQYRSAIFAVNDQELSVARAYRDSLEGSGAYAKPIATEIVPFTRFWEAEEYHQNFERLNPEHPYIRNVSIPRLQRFQAKHRELLKDQQQEH